jgi:hypothetical protein
LWIHPREDVRKSAIPTRVRGPGHHLRGDAGPVRALATDEVGLDADDVEPGVRDALREQLAADADAEHDDVSRLGHRSRLRPERLRP